MEEDRVILSKFWTHDGASILMRKKLISFHFGEYLVFVEYMKMRNRVTSREYRVYKPCNISENTFELRKTINFFFILAAIVDFHRKYEIALIS